MIQEAFSNLVLTNEQTLYRIAATLLPRLQDRQDAVQSAVLLAWQHRFSLREEERFKPWIARILVRECYRLLRKAKPLVLTDSFPEGVVPMRDERLHEAIMALPEKQRIVIVLYYIEGMGQDEIAKVLSIPKGTVKSRLNTGRTKLGQLLKQEVQT